jgi:N-acetylglucosamine-6-phosphate deacetylase
MMSHEKRVIFSGMSVLLENKWAQYKAVVIESGKITAIIADDMIKHHLPAAHHEFSSDHYLVPGFIDLHVHGAGGDDVMDGTIQALTGISDRLASEGVTGFLATTMTEQTERIEAALSVIPAAVKQAKGAAMLGVHLEGPFIAREKMGAQQGEHVRTPDIELFKRWQALAGNQIRLVTLAPELENALPFIQALCAMDVIPAIGHTDATYHQTMAAIAAGSTYATHLFNAMRGMHQREPGVVGAVLLAPTVFAELIADGKHAHPAMCELALQVKGKDRLLLVTDAMRAKCMGDGCYELGGQTVTVKAGKATLADGTLAGSVLRMSDAIKNIIKFTHCSLADAITMASMNPARQLKIADHKGSIDIGKDADLVVLSQALSVQLTMRAGKVVFKV